MQALTETEVKLEASAATLAALVQSPLLNNWRQGEWRELMLYNQYFDTDDWILDRHALALRVRRDGDQSIQTLKSRGQSQQGLSVRDEWDWYLQQPVLDRSLLTGTCWPEALTGLDLAALKPLFSTDFQRVKALLSWCWQGENVSVEVACDRGWVLSEQGRAEICELELELREGPQQALLDFAAQLQSRFVLTPCDVSKAERGYRLLRAMSAEEPFDER